MCVPRCACEGQRTTCRSRFSLSATWVPGIELSSAAGAFCLLSHVAISTWVLSASPRLCSRLTAAADAKGADERNRPLVRIRLALSLNVRFPAGVAATPESRSGSSASRPSRGGPAPSRMRCRVAARGDGSPAQAPPPDWSTAAT